MFLYGSTILAPGGGREQLLQSFGRGNTGGNGEVGLMGSPHLFSFEEERVGGQDSRITRKQG